MKNLLKTIIEILVEMRSIKGKHLAAKYLKGH